MKQKKTPEFVFKCSTDSTEFKSRQAVQKEFSCYRETKHSWNNKFVFLCGVNLNVSKFF